MLKFLALAGALLWGADEPQTPQTPETAPAVAEAPVDDGSPTYVLKEDVSVGSQTTTRLHLVIEGKVHTADNDIPLAGQALLEYPEKVLKLGEDGLPSKVARYYNDARAKFVLGNTGEARQLRPDLRLVVGDYDEHSSLVLWSPAGPFLSDEVELVQEVLDTTKIAGILPSKAVKLNEKWQPGEATVKAMCDLDHFISSDIECTLALVWDDLATIKIAGKAQGLSIGTEVTVKVDADAQYDMKRGVITRLTWTQSDARTPGPVSPAGSYVAKITVDRSRQESPRLSDDVLSKVDVEAKANSLALLFRDPSGRFNFTHDRNWHITGLRDDLVVFRKIQGSDFAVQLNVTPMQDRPAGTQMTVDDFKKMIGQTEGWQITDFGPVSEVPATGNFNIRRVTASGDSAELKMMQRHYLVTSPNGRQMVFSFLMDPKFEEKIGQEDVSLVNTVHFTEGTAKKSSDQTR